MEWQAFQKRKLFCSKAFRNYSHRRRPRILHRGEMPPAVLSCQLPQMGPQLVSFGTIKRMMQASIDQVFEQLGGKDAIGVKVRSESEMERLLREGLPASVLKNFRENWGFTVMELAGSLAIPKSTLMRMLERRNRLAPGDSDRVYRFASILALAEVAIGDRKKAQRWLREANQVLGNQTPLRALETEIGVRRVEQVLGRIAYGGLS